MTDLHILCPLDGLPLHTEHNVARCSAGHAFDWAKEGYLNILPVHAKQSKDPGDSALMVQARRRFLSAGHYNNLIDAIGHAIPQDARYILDAGCGEGSYIHRLQTTSDTNRTVFYGLDISKHAIKSAAKAYPDTTWLVASNRQLPFPSHSLDVIICAFGFPVWTEFKRVLKPSGLVILVDPAPKHLIELRQTLYDQVIEKETDFVTPDSFTLRSTEIVSDVITLTDAHIIADLIAMTPHQHRATPTAIVHACATGFPALTVQATIRMLQA